MFRGFISMEDTNQKDGPVFETEPGWGGKLAGWFGGGGMSWILPAAAIVVLIIGLVMYFGKGGTNNKLAGTSPSPSQQNQGIEVTFVLKDNPTLVARRAITICINVDPLLVSLTNGQRIYMETKLAPKIKGPFTVGNKVTIQYSDLAALVQSAQALTPAQLSSWEVYGRNIKF
ncbi:MAG: hypothetical protein CEN90_180 [Parcubacteria group bacterium Licking1014_17]|nr:MAG: hypothetical protein CEN90_180 [Parcubacteria group bacterium Licking1014_17]